MLWYKCFSWNRITCSSPSEPELFSLPAPIPEWPQGQGFGSGIVNLGELEVFKITRFGLVWNSKVTLDKRTAREVKTYSPETADISNHDKLPALQNPLDYTLVWSPDAGSEEELIGCGYFWLPQPPEGYKALGYLVSNKPDKPELDDMKCVQSDLTDKCEPYCLILDAGYKFPEFPFQVWSIRPIDRGMSGKGVSVGTFFCSSYCSKGDEIPVACLKNLNHVQTSMPNLDQIHALVKHYGPTIFFHPKEVYLPSSVDWFFNNGALLCRKGYSPGESIDATGSNLPGGGTSDGQFWIDLPSDERRDFVKHGNLQSAKLYVHVKPALGGTFTDIAIWVFCPFNGPVTLKFGIMDMALSKIGQHVGDWEHFTLRICNFNGELWSIYYSQHSGGEWVDAHGLEYIDGNKATVYSSKAGHASYPHPGTYIQGSSRLGIGIRNDAAHSNLFVDSSTHYELVAAEYLGDGVISEPQWLQFMGEWGPKIVYGSKTELDRILNTLPLRLRNPLESIFKKLPLELYGEEGPTGPKEKNNWRGDERW
ncbi:hypothetical protein K1719_042059 [Acacia pycnantha]|nr:hypothetical protein K1719_042059 [Acacia pycnantha]